MYPCSILPHNSTPRRKFRTATSVRQRCVRPARRSARTPGRRVRRRIQTRGVQTARQRSMASPGDRQRMKRAGASQSRGARATLRALVALRTIVQCSRSQVADGMYKSGTSSTRNRNSPNMRVPSTQQRPSLMVGIEQGTESSLRRAPVPMKAEVVRTRRLAWQRNVPYGVTHERPASHANFTQSGEEYPKDRDRDDGRKHLDERAATVSGEWIRTSASR